MTDTVVLFSDIIGWTGPGSDTNTQVNQATSLFDETRTRFENFGLEKPLWMTSTGDGFAIAFPLDACVKLINLSADLHNRFMRDDFPDLRLAIAGGPTRDFYNPLIEGQDRTGPAIIKARRILDGITGSNTLLAEESLAMDRIDKLPIDLQCRLVPHPPIRDKNGKEHRVVQVLSSREFPETREPLPTFDELSRSTRSPDIDKNLFAIDGLIILWMSHHPDGLEATALTLDKVDTNGLHPKTGLPERFTKHVMNHWEEIKTKHQRGGNKQKVWISDYRVPISDRPTLALTIGETNYFTARALEMAFDSFDGLRQEFDNKKHDILNDLPNLVAAHAIILTNDQHVILAQRKPKQVDYAGGEWSVSFEEQWAPDLDSAPYDTILRGLSEEFNVDANHGVPVSVDNVQLLALGREWGVHWNIAMVYLVRLPVDAKTVLDCWDRTPPPEDKNENLTVAAVPISEDDGKTFLYDLLNREKNILRSDLERVCGPDRIKGSPLPDKQSYPPHRTTGRARILFALWAAGVIA